MGVTERNDERAETLSTQETSEKRAKLATDILTIVAGENHDDCPKVTTVMSTRSQKTIFLPRSGQEESHHVLSQVGIEQVQRPYLKECGFGGRWGQTHPSARGHKEHASRVLTFDREENLARGTIIDVSYGGMKAGLVQTRRHQRHARAG